MAGLTFKDVSVSRGEFRVGPLSAHFEQGSIIAMVGQNGSGKPTLLRGLLGLAGRVEGALEIDETEIKPGGSQLRSRVGYMPDDPDEIFHEMSVTEYLTFVASCRASTAPDRAGRQAARARHLQNAQKILARLDLPMRGGRMATFSHGMRSKAQLTAALMVSPPLLLLDEPRNGLDPMALIELENLLRAAASNGATIVVSSHDLDWVERIATSWIVVRRGEILAAEGIDPSQSSIRRRFFELVGEAPRAR